MMNSKPQTMDRDRGGRRFVGLVLLSAVFLLYYFCQAACSVPHVLHGDNKREPASVLRKLHWIEASDPGVAVNLSSGHVLQGWNSTLGDDSDVECRDVLKEDKKDRCGFVKVTDDCQIDEGFIDYTEFVYCTFGPGLQALGMVILFMWWIFLFVGLAVTADDFFCPALSVISETMHLSHNIAGVTFLAFGNGAPDIFSAIAAIGNAKNGDAGLAIGALFGAGVFVTTVVAGSIAVICPFQAMQRPFLRDVIFYLAATFWSFTILWKKKISQFEAIGFILMYVGYVLVVVFGRYIHKKLQAAFPLQNAGDNDEEEITEHVNRPSDTFHDQMHLSNPCGVQDVGDKDEEEIPEHVNRPSEREPLLGDRINNSVEEDINTESVGPWREFLSAINPIDIDNWRPMKWYAKIYEVFKSPILFLLIITVPVVDQKEDKNKWNRHLNSLQCFTGLTFGSFATKVGFDTLGNTLPVWALLPPIGFILGLIVFFTSKNDAPPKYQPAFAYLGFLVAVIWIYSVANEIVNILQTFGIVLDISNAILGLTLLAWGNSIGDFIADTVMARQGYPRMGISACFGGPLFNLLLGIGIPFTIGTLKNGGIYELKITFEEVVLAAFLMLSLVTSLIIVPLSKFKMSRMYGIILIVLYVVFLVVAILAESKVIDVKL